MSVASAGVMRISLNATGRRSFSVRPVVYLA